MIEPFLRSPPFPRVPGATASVSRPADDGAAVDDALLDLIAQARVGGRFWGEKREGARIMVGRGVSLSSEQVASHAADLGYVGGGNHTSAGPVVLPDDCDPWTLLSRCERLYAHPDDELALIAGLAGIEVIGPDGLLIGGPTLRQRLKARIAAAVYRDCFSGEDADAARAVDILSDWRRHIDRNRGVAAAVGMAFWKRDAIRQFLWDGRRSPPFLSPGKALARARREKGALAVWPSRVPADLPERAAARGIGVARVEDGFIRSKGLGAALHPPGSVVIDRSGIYYDGRGPNDLETLLATHIFSDTIKDRAARLRERICATGVTKYGDEGRAAIALPEGRRTVLAVGQVDDDLSVRWGGAGVAGNLDFLERVRRAEPDAWIVYRPHPDVQAGLRKGHIADAAVLKIADAIDTGAPLMPMTQAVDCVHVLSSLTGFEALMRGCDVTVHGLPFYAGWGLTRDLAPTPNRRGRNLALDELVAGALILYPSYLDPVTNLPCGPEIMVERLSDGSETSATSLIRLRGLQGKLKRFMILSAEFIRG